IVLPLITAQSEIDLINTSNTSGAALIRLLGPEGQEIAEYTPIVFLQPMGAVKAASIPMFTATDLARASHAKITCMVSCVGAVLVRDFMAAPSLAVANGRSTASTTTRLDFAHVIDGTLGGLSYSTILSVTNLTNIAQTITITFTPDNGSGPVTVQRDLM